jgi:hypothetical protein
MFQGVADPEFRNHLDVTCPGWQLEFPLYNNLRSDKSKSECWLPLLNMNKIQRLVQKQHISLHELFFNQYTAERRLLLILKKIADGERNKYRLDTAKINLQ